MIPGIDAAIKKAPLYPVKDFTALYKYILHYIALHYYYYYYPLCTLRSTIHKRGPHPERDPIIA